uniref:Uncharacterized protein n=1 Tax=Anguilla anguilla TaxID=7936 RepID=A0A0E9VFG0_ANGAN
MMNQTVDLACPGFFQCS